MNVYTLERTEEFQGENYEILGVFSTPEKAMAETKNDPNSDGVELDWAGNERGDLWSASYNRYNWFVSGWEVDG